MKKLILACSKYLILAFSLATLAGCAATQVALSKKDLDVQTRTSASIFVDPVPAAKRTIYLDIRSGVMEFNRNAFTQFVKDQFANGGSGYRVVDNPDEAQFVMLAYVLNLEKSSPTAAEAALNGGYMGGAVASGAAVGAIANNSHRWRGAAVGGIAGGAAEFVAGSLVKDVTYMLVCDIQVSEQTKHGAIVRTDTQIDTKVSDSGSSRQTVSEVSNRKEYKTRIVTTANKVNLKLEDAQDLMFQKTAFALAGFF